METRLLHDDLLEEILVRLPVKSLLKFRCVCKSWYTSITSNRFILAHVSHNNSAKNHHILLRSFNKADKKDNVILWNPVIRRFLALPKLELNVDITDLGRIVFGFGYDSFKNDYKVIKIVYCKNPDFEARLVEASVAIFRLSSCCWEVNGSASVPLLDTRQANVNGFIHWLAYNKLVVGFDVKNEAFSDFMLPETLQDANISDLTIASWCDFLSVFQNGYWSGKLCLWVMKDYGVPGSWVKQFVIHSYLMVRSLRGNGCVMLENIGGNLVMYNKETNQFKEFKILVEGSVRSFHMKSYVESLVLLDRMNSQLIS